PFLVHRKDPHLGDVHDATPLDATRLHNTPEWTVRPRLTSCQTDARRAITAGALREIRPCFQRHVHRDICAPRRGRAKTRRLERYDEVMGAVDVLEQIAPITLEHDS